MFTSRAEHRLLLREDNADFRLREIGHGLGLVSDDVYQQFCRKKGAVDALVHRLDEFKLRPEAGILDRLKELGPTAPKTTCIL